MTVPNALASITGSCRIYVKLVAGLSVLRSKPMMGSRQQICDSIAMNSTNCFHSENARTIYNLNVCTNIPALMSKMVAVCAKCARNDVLLKR